MTIHQKIKEDLKSFMREKSLLKEFVKVVLSEFDREGKNLLDDKVLPILEKMLKNAKEFGSSEEVAYLESYIPKKMSEKEITFQVNALINSGIKNIGGIMQAFNKNFKGKADNKLVSEIAKNLLNN